MAGGQVGTDARPAWRGYAVAVVSALASLVVRIALQPVLENTTIFLLLVPAVFTGAIVGGLGPAVTAMVIALIGMGLFVGPHHLADAPNTISAVVFVLVSLGMGWAGGLLRRRQS